MEHVPSPVARARPIGRVTTATRIFQTLLDEIVSLRLKPGTPLNDRALVERFGVSRTPVREALIRLAEMELVDVFPQSGTFVSRVPVHVIPEAVLVRTALEGATVEKAALSPSHKNLFRLDAILAQQSVLAAGGDTDAFHEADEAFHAELAAIAGHPGVWRLVTQVKIQIDRARRLTLPAFGRMEGVVAEHRLIRDRVAAGDAPGARGAIEAHLHAVIPDVAALRERHPDYFT
ncbi:GntR family transcriptional regulator [Aureimonas sp. ME7]|uniref:GntR family transcriptional regulator n=1 Tax=Aureimonas sp. ME7 TaxID=2744252 RepID=UPI0015F4F130|nr:GntR family transcriptional regulator [Aureimonas sp. ME7]